MRGGCSLDHDLKIYSLCEGEAHNGHETSADVSGSGLAHCLFQSLRYLNYPEQEGNEPSTANHGRIRPLIISAGGLIAKERARELEAKIRRNNSITACWQESVWIC